MMDGTAQPQRLEQLLLRPVVEMPISVTSADPLALAVCLHTPVWSGSLDQHQVVEALSTFSLDSQEQKSAEQ